MNEYEKQAIIRLISAQYEPFEFKPFSYHMFGDIRHIPKIKKVIFNEPATIVIWSDGTKTVVKCGENDIYDPEKGLAMAIAKKALGNKGNYFNEIKKWTEPWYEENEKKFAEEEGDAVANALKRISEQAIQVGKAIESCNFHIERPIGLKWCKDCKHEDLPVTTQPCIGCVKAAQRVNWQPKDESCQ